MIMKKMAAVAAAAATCFAVLALAGCAAQPLQIGSADASDASFEAVNETGVAVTGIAIKDAGESEYPQNLQQEADWAAGEKATISYTAPTEAPSAEGDGEDAGDLILSPTSDIRIETADGRTFEIHQMNFADFQDAKLMVEGDLAYFTYTSKESGEQVDTLESEKAYQENVKAEAERKAAEEEAARQAAEEAERKAAEEEAARQTAEQQAAAQKKAASQQSAKQSTQSTSTQSTGGSTGGRAASSGEDECVDDLIFN